MLRVLLPDDNHAERRYIAEVILGDFLGLPVQIEFGESRHSILETENGARLVLEDHFFNQFPNEKSYLDRQNIPQQVLFQKKSSNPFLPEDDLPVIFGNDKTEVSGKEIICGIDIFASAFFMLTRWEEYACNERDSLGRFPGKASLAGRAGFLHRPLVNEYIEMLWAMLTHLGIRQERKKQSFRLLLTHDVDYPLLWTSPFFFLKKLGGDVLKRGSLTEAAFSARSYVSTKYGGKKDPYDTFDYLMQIAENVNVPAHFFFMAGGKSKLDPKYAIAQDFVKKLMARIHERGHRIGIHPSFDSFNDDQVFEAEKRQLEAVSPQPVTCGRQHFLRFSVPETWQIWANNNMEWDSTLGYPEKEGFRCGVCYPFPVFDVEERKTLPLKEYPLIVMEGSLQVYQNLCSEKMQKQVRQMLKSVKKYEGTFTFLWHNSAFNTPQYLPYRHLYEELVREASGLQA